MKKRNMVTGLAGAAALAGASQAYGSVVVLAPPANILGNDPSSTNTAPKTVLVDLDGNGTNDLELAYRSFTTSGYVIQQSFVFSASGQTASLYGQYGSYTYQIGSGKTVPGAYAFNQSATYLSHLTTHVNSNDYGFWYLGDRGFVGFSFTDKNGHLDYGYIQLETDAFQNAANPGGLKFFSLAYDDSGAPIAAGAVPEPSTLAALVVGGFGLTAAAMRKRRSQAEANA